MSTGTSSNSPHEAPPCAICGGIVDGGSNTCTRCGANASKVGRCAHCQAVASVQAHRELLWKCSVCGAARLTQEQCESIDALQRSLSDATRAHNLARLSRIVTYFGAGLGLIGLFFALAIKLAFSPGDGTSWALFGLPSLALLFTLVSWLKSRGFGQSRDAFLDNAYSLAIVELLSKGACGTTSSRLAAALGIETRRAERLLASLNVRDDIESEVTDDGQIAYFTRGRALPNESVQLVQPVTERLRLPDSQGATETLSMPDGEPSAEVKTQLSSVVKT